MKKSILKITTLGWILLSLLEFIRKTMSTIITFGELFLQKLLMNEFSAKFSDVIQLEVYTEFVKIYIEGLYDSILDLEYNELLENQQNIKIVLNKVETIISTQEELPEPLRKKFSQFQKELNLIQNDIQALLSPAPEVDESSEDYCEFLGLLAEESLKSGLTVSYNSLKELITLSK